MKIRTKLQKAALVTTGYLLGLMVTATTITWANADTISAFLNQPNAIKVDLEGDENENTDLEYYKSDYTTLKDVVYNGFQIQEEEQKEGTILLKNDNNTLPLAKGSKVSVFGVTGASTFYGASGSGGINTKEAIGWYDAFRGYSHSDRNNPTSKVKGDVLLDINEKLATDYTNWLDSKHSSYSASYTPSSSASKVNIGDVPWDVVKQSEGYKDIATYGKSAIYIIKRTGGEGYDLPATSGTNEQYGNVNNAVPSVNDGVNGDYLQLSETEISVLEGLNELKKEGTIDNIVLILNMASTIQLDFLQDDRYGIDACVWSGAVGEVGTVAVAKLLTGEYNFSGGAATTLWSDNLMNPVNSNFMDQNYYFTYPNYSEFGFINPALDNQYQSTFTTYTVYQEGMYLGYKYTETRYEDYVMNTKNVGEYNYDDVVAYPFGYGLSYSEFEFSNLKVTKKDKAYDVTVTVTNTGNTKGKTPVQIYVAKPYTDYAKEHDIQVPSIELIDFGKTNEIEAGEHEEVTITVNEKYFSTFDTFGAGTYVTLEGTYYLIAAQNAHDAVNNLLAAKGYTTANTSGRMDADGNEDLVYSTNYSFDDKTWSISTKTGNPITRSFDFVDINTYEGKGDNEVEYYSRDNWNGTVKLPTRKSDGTLVKYNAELTLTQEMADSMRDQMDAGKVIEKGGEYPTYGANNGLVLLDMQGLSYENSLWDDLLDQLTWDETVDLLSNGRHKTQAIESIAKPGTGDENGPNGFNSTNYGYATAGGRFSGPTNPFAERAGGKDEEGNYIPDPDIESGFTLTGFSSNGVLAATFNREIAKKVGQQIGNEGIWGGMSGLLGLGMNILRSPYAGRTSEYYSEDANLTGLICVPEIQEIEKRGVHCFIKHCALNECETARHGVNTWVNEQALRENYLRAFEIGIQDGGAYNVMTSFSRMGTEAVANSATFTKAFLRNECGLPGIVETDCAGDMTDGAHGEAYVSRICNVYTGATDLNEYNYAADAPDYTGSSYTYQSFAPTSEGGTGEYGNLGQAMREASKRIIYATLTTNAMNGLSSNSRIIRITPTWQKLVVAGDVVISVAFAASMGWILVTAFLDYRKKKAN